MLRRTLVLALRYDKGINSQGGYKDYPYVASDFQIKNDNEGVICSLSGQLPRRILYHSSRVLLFFQGEVFHLRKSFPFHRRCLQCHPCRCSS